MEESGYSRVLLCCGGGVKSAAGKENAFWGENECLSGRDRSRPEVGRLEGKGARAQDAPAITTITANRKCNVFAVPKETFRNRECAE